MEPQKQIFQKPLLLVCVVEHTQESMRIDQYIALQLKPYSRSYVKKLLHCGYVSLDNKVINKASTIVKEGASLEVRLPKDAGNNIVPKNTDQFDISIVFENDDFLIINKPSGLSVHPPVHTYEPPTLIDWLVKRMPFLKEVGDSDRPGIVHRLDKDTSGLMIIPKNIIAHGIFGKLFSERYIQKIYHAVAMGCPPSEGEINFAIGRDVHNPTKKSHFVYGHAYARAAKSNYRVLEYFKNYAFLEVKPITGRTHQIRVHCAAIGHPIVGDAVYGSASSLIKRHALHAYGLEFTFKDVKYSFSVEPPADFIELVGAIRK